MPGPIDFGRVIDFDVLCHDVNGRVTGFDVIARQCLGQPLFDPPGFDKRPGQFEATCGLEAAPVAVAARHDVQGWQVQLIADGVVLARLSIEDALALAADIAATAEIAAGNWE